VINKDRRSHRRSAGQAAGMLLMLTHVYPQPQAAPSLLFPTFPPPYLRSGPTEGGIVGNSQSRSLTESTDFNFVQRGIKPLSLLHLFSRSLSLAPRTNKYLSSLLIKQRAEKHKGKLTTNHPRALHTNGRAQTRRRTELVEKRLAGCDLRGPLHADSGLHQ